jgi:hypothetical protein
VELDRIYSVTKEVTNLISAKQLSWPFVSPCHHGGPISTPLSVIEIEISGLETRK